MKGRCRNNMLGTLLLSMLSGGGAGLFGGVLRRKQEKKLKNQQADSAQEDFTALMEQRQAQALYNGVEIDEGSPLALVSERKRRGMKDIEDFRTSNLTNPLTSMIKGLFGGFNKAVDGKDEMKSFLKLLGLDS